ncbi:MAG: DUF4239 domain-containing protein [Gammaproteobacteria bacterium]
MELRPSFLILPGMILVAVCAALVRKFVPMYFLRSHHEVAFPIFLQIGVIYAMLLGFCFSIEWDGFRAAQTGLEAEAANLLELGNIAQAFPEPMSTQLQIQIIAYLKAVIYQDWSPQGWNIVIKPLSNQAIFKIQQILLLYNPDNRQESNLYQLAMQNLQKVIENREMRFFKIRQRPPTPLWGALIVMGVIIIGISFLFAMHYLWSQVILTTVLAGMIFAIITMMIAFNSPFSGHYQLTPRPFQEVLYQMTTHQTVREHHV